MSEICTRELFDLSHTKAAALLEGCEYPWHVLSKIKDFILETGKTLPADEYDNPSEGVWIAKDAKIAPSAVINGPVIVGKGSELRTGAYIRGSVIIGDGCVVGNSCEVKNAILFDGVQVPHFNYIGDSVLGYKAHTGAGAVTSNVKSDKSLVRVRCSEGTFETGLKKFGAMIGDFAEIGCNCVLNPGTVIGRNTIVYPLSSVRGTVPADSIYKGEGRIATKEKFRT